MNEFDKHSKMNQGKSIAKIIEDAFIGIESSMEEIGDIESITEFETDDSDLIKKRNLLKLIHKEIDKNK